MERQGKSHVNFSTGRAAMAVTGSALLGILTLSLLYAGLPFFGTLLFAGCLGWCSSEYDKFRPGCFWADALDDRGGVNGSWLRPVWRMAAGIEPNGHTAVV